MKNILFLLSIISFSAIANNNSSHESYSDLKHKIDFFENSVIKEFSFSVPGDFKDSFNSPEQIKYGILLEEKYQDQKNAFFKAEHELYVIEQSLSSRVKKGELTEEESNKLFTSVEYARRIILDARKNEVIERYQEFKKKLSIRPSLLAFHEKIKESKLPGKCEVSNAKINPENQTVEFLIKGIDISGEPSETLFSVSEENIEQGYLFTRFDRGQHYGVTDKIIINFTQVLPDQSVQRFTLYEDPKGKLYHAEFFHDEIQKPWVDILGLFNIGSITENKKIICNDLGRLPASLTHNAIPHQ